MTGAIYLHVGAPKSGTTYIQDRLDRNVRSLARHGVYFPSQLPRVSGPLFQFRAALDLLGQDWGGHPGHADGTWAALVRKVRRRGGTVIVSHEIFAAAKPEHVAKVKRDLAGQNLHIVYSARDLARQVPAAWQESIKQGRGWSYAGFVRRVERNQAWFARAFDLPTVLTNWGSGLPPGHVHVVTVPHREQAVARPDLLWDRFCEAVDIDPAWAPADATRRNPSLGIVETQVLRRLNRRLGNSARRGAVYDRLIRERLAEAEFAGRLSPPVRLPPTSYPWALERTEHWIEWLESSGVDVVGDLDDLRPQPDDLPWRDPDRVSAKKQLGASLDALAAMTREAGRRPDPDRALAHKVRVTARRLRGS